MSYTIPIYWYPVLTLWQWTDEGGLLTDGVLIVFGGWTMVHCSVVLCSAAAADWHDVLSVE